MSCSNCNSDPCCCNPHPTPAAPIISVESSPAAVPECPDCPPVIHEELDSFVMPAPDENVGVEVCDPDAWPVGMCVNVTDGTRTGVLRIISKSEASSMIYIENIGDEFNEPEGTVFVGDIYMLLSGICPTPAEEDCHVLGVRTVAAVTIPALGGSVEITLNRCVDLEVGQRLHIADYGCVVVDEVIEISPLAIFVATFDSLWYGSVEGDIIPANSAVTTAEFCLEWDNETITGAGTHEDPLRATNPTGFIGAVEESSDWNPGGTPANDPSMTLDINVELHDRIMLTCQVSAYSPRAGMLLQLTGGSGGATKEYGFRADMEDGHDGVPDTSPLFTVTWTEIWSVTAAGSLQFKMRAEDTRDSLGPEQIIYNRLIAAVKV